MRINLFAIVCGVALATCGSAAQGPPQRPRAEVTPVAPAAPIARGTEARLTLKVKLPDGIHVQSNKPRDPLLIATVLTVDASAGATVTGVTYPKAVDFKQAGQKEPLAVFEHEFSIGVGVKVPTAAAAGQLAVPVRLRYQACNDQICFAPATATAAWTLTVK